MLKFFVNIFKTLIEKNIYFYTTVNGFLDQKFITFLTNEKNVNEFNKTKNMDLETLIKEFYDTHHKIKILLITINKKLTKEIEKEVSEIFNNTTTLTIIFYKICIKDNATNSDISDFFIEKYTKKIINTFKNLYYIFYYYNYIKHFRIRDNKKKKHISTKNYQDNLNIQLINEIKKSLEYAILIIIKMDTNIYKRNLKITSEENLQKKAQDAENEKYDTSYLNKKTNANNCILL